MTGRFPLTRLREGYAIAEVDLFLAQVEPRVLGRDPGVVERLRDVRFTPVRLRQGYDMAAVDQHLDDLLHRAGG